MDVWLWAARFYKTRALAKRACELGRVEAHGQTVKPAREVHAGDRLKVTNDSGDFEIDVLGLREVRGPAAVAQSLYRETEASIEARKKMAEMRKNDPFFEPSYQGSGRPTKRDRRKIIRFRRGE